MQYVDPLRSYRFDHGLQWVYNPDDSLLNCTVFDSFTQPARRLSVCVTPERPEPRRRGPKLAELGQLELGQRELEQLEVFLEPGKTVISTMLGDGRRLRALRIRERGLRITACEVSGDPADGPDLSDQLALIKSSIGVSDATPEKYAFWSRMAAEARLFQEIRRTALEQGQYPGTRLVHGLVQEMTALVVSQQSASRASQAEIFARLQNNFLWNGGLGGNAKEFPAARRMRMDVYASIDRLAQQAGMGVPPEADALYVAFVIAEIARNSLPDDDTSDQPEVTAPLLGLALSQFLVAARRYPDLLGLLFTPPTSGQPVPPPGFSPEQQLLTLRIGDVASRLADARNALGQHGDCVAAHRLSVAALRLLTAHDPGMLISGWPVRGLLGDQLFTFSEHLWQADDPLSHREAEALRQEADEIGARGADEKRTRAGVQEVRDFLAAVDSGQGAEAERLAAQILDPSWEDTADAPVEALIIRADVSRLTGDTKEMAAATETALRLLGVSFGPAAETAGQPGTGKPGNRGKTAELTAEAAVERAQNLTQLSYLLGAMGRRPDAITLLHQAAALAGGHAPVSELSLRVLRAGAEALDADGDGLLAARLSLAAALVIDGLRLEQAVGEDRIRQLDGTEEARVVRYAVELNLNAGRRLEALSAADRARGRGLLDSVQGGGRVLHPDSSAAGPGWDGTSTDRPLEQLSTIVAAVVAQRYRAAGAAVPLRPGQLDALALQPVTFLVPQPLDDELALFVLDGEGGVHVERVPVDLGQMSHRVTLVRDAMWVRTVTRGSQDAPAASSVAPPVDGLLRELYDTLIAPVAARLPPGRPLVIVPHHDLALLPWSALTSPDGRYLVEDYQVSVVPSLAIWESLSRRATAPPPLRAYLAADPKLDKTLLSLYSQLPSARSDAKRLGALLTAASAGGPPPVILVGPEATETSYRVSGEGASLVHFACHAELGATAAESCLFLASDREHDGRLTAAEVSSIRLDRALVFLSACETGQGRLSAEGVIGLGQAFLDAGAQAVILTLCGVSDAVASCLSAHFYEHLLPPGETPGSTAGPAGERTAGAALQLALLATLKDLKAGRVIENDGTVLPPLPQVWAAFFVLGRESARIGGPEGG